MSHACFLKIGKGTQAASYQIPCCVLWLTVRLFYDLWLLSPLLLVLDAAPPGYNHGNAALFALQWPAWGLTSQRPKRFQGEHLWVSGLLSQQSLAFSSKMPKQHQEAVAMKKGRLWKVAVSRWFSFTHFLEILLAVPRILSTTTIFWLKQIFKDARYLINFNALLRL